MKRLLIAICLLCTALAASAQEAPERDPNELYAVIVTNRGTMEFLLYRQVAPLTVTSFVNLATRGFYDGLKFHRVVDGFMAQGGDPRGNGSGGPGYEFEDEIALRLNQEGILAMANSGPNTNGSQFFITFASAPHLNGAHTVFGLVQSGRQVIRQLRINDTIESITIIGDAKKFLERRKDQVYQWNRTLDFNFSNLKAPLTD